MATVTISSSHPGAEQLLELSQDSHGLETAALRVAQSDWSPMTATAGRDALSLSRGYLGDVGPRTVLRGIRGRRGLGRSCDVPPDR
jgi:hypothetical protein